jgi:hypothetical protein
MEVKVIPKKTGPLDKFAYAKPAVTVVAPEIKKASNDMSIGNSDNLKKV